MFTIILHKKFKPLPCIPQKVCESFQCWFHVEDRSGTNKLVCSVAWLDSIESLFRKCMVQLDVLMSSSQGLHKQLFWVVINVLIQPETSWCNNNLDVCNYFAKEVQTSWKAVWHQCTMSPLLTRNCFKSNKVRPISNCWFCRLIYKNICLNVFESKQRREKLVFVIL